MPADQNNHSIAELERKLLHALIGKAQMQGAASSNVSEAVITILDKLARHEWMDEEHRVVYECLRAAARRNRNETLRERMAVEATRKGHPDVDWDFYFGLPSDPADLFSLLHSLETGSRE